jgi:hypothetical protein
MENKPIEQCPSCGSPLHDAAPRSAETAFQKDLRRLDATYTSSAGVPEDLAFQKELAILINRHSVESASLTPDFLLASYMKDCLATWNKHQLLRDRWWTATQPTGHEPDRRGGE